MQAELKRISLMVRQEQLCQLQSREVNLSGLVRDLIDDHLSEHKIVISVSEETKQLYDRIISNSGSTDVDVEVYFRRALKDMLDDRIRAMNELREKSFGDQHD